MKTGDLKCRFEKYVRENLLLDNVRTVVAAVSGGVDSVCLLDLLLGRDPRKYEIVVVHFNHQLRGAEADRDEKIVRDFCAEHALIFFRETADVRQFARAKHFSLEMAGRELRYAFFRKVASGYMQSVIATAHTLDDQAETILMRMLKGSGLQGLSGIAPRRENIIRPLLFAKKSELYEYARQRQLNFAEDHTNLLLDCQRNIIRNHLLPEIKTNLNPNIVVTLSNLAQNLAEAQQVIVKSASLALPDLIVATDSEQIVLDKSGLKTYFIAIEKEIIWQCLRRLAGAIQPLSFRQMNRLLNLVNNGKTGRQMTLAGDISAAIDRDRLILRRARQPEWPEMVFSPGQSVENEFFTLTSEPLAVSQYRRPERHSMTEFVDLERLGNNLVLRHWRKGDRIKPLGMQNFRKVSDLFVDLKIPRQRKNTIPILTSDDRIVWLCGLTLSDEFKITPHTKTILRLTYKEKQI